MALNRSAIRDLLLPGLAGIEGKYAQLPKRWSEFLTYSTSKMATERYVEMRYTSLAQIKAEGGATPMDNAPGERFVYNAEHRSIGLGTAITREALDDNLYKDEFSPRSIGLMESFAQTKEIFAAALLNTATTYNSLIGGDGVALCSTAHPIDNNTYANTFSTQLDLNEAAIETSLNLIQTFPDQAGNLQWHRGRKLTVPVALQWTAERITKTELRTGTADNDVSAIYTTGALPEGYAVNEFLTSNFAWFVQTDVKALRMLDRVPLELDLQVDPVTGNLLIIGYERYAITYSNPRSVFGSFPTA